LFGVRDFICDFPKNTVRDFEICTKTCRIGQNQASQYAEVLFTCASKEGKPFELIAQMVCQWFRKETRWKIQEMKTDLFGLCGAVETARIKSIAGESRNTGREEEMLCIQAETDSPWLRILDAQMESDEEEILDCYARYCFGINHNCFLHCVEALSTNYGGNMVAGDGKMRNSQVAAWKKERQQRKSWTDPVRIKQLEIHGDRAFITGELILDKDRRRPIFFSEKRESGMPESCGKVRIELVRENGYWKIAYLKRDYGFFGISCALCQKILEEK
jgi:hypothetical protein